jgi:hypothetical protein
MVFFAHDFARQAGAVWFYLSTSSYTTRGYGDVVLPRMWRT